MADTGPRYSGEEFRRRGEAIFERDVRPRVEDSSPRDFVLIDIETGDFEVDGDEMAASDRLLARRPDAQVWMRRVGSPYDRRFGGRLRWSTR
jgi:hypothetical protein